MEMPIAEVVDRYSILVLKMKRQPVTPSLTAEHDAFKAQVDASTTQPLFLQLLDVNGRIWDLEGDIRQGKEHQLGLEEVGRRALAIRDLNRERIRIKNLIAQIVGGHIEVKHNHASSTDI